MRLRGAGVRVGPLRSPMQCLADRMAMADGVGDRMPAGDGGMAWRVEAACISRRGHLIFPTS